MTSMSNKRYVVRKDSGMVWYYKHIVDLTEAFFQCVEQVFRTPPFHLPICCEIEGLTCPVKTGSGQW